MAIFYDSARWGLIPAGADAALYTDGRYSATLAQSKRFGKVRWITVLGGSAVAAKAGAADFEEGNSVHDVPGKLRSWALERQAMNCRARVYCNRSDLPRAHSLVGDIPGVVYWIATLDNKEWTLPEIVANILAVARLEIPPAKIWAVQYAGGMTAKFDTSVLLGTW